MTKNSLNLYYILTNVINFMTKIFNLIYIINQAINFFLKQDLKYWIDKLF